MIRSLCSSHMSATCATVGLPVAFGTSSRRAAATKSRSMRLTSVSFDAFTVFVRRLPSASRTVSCQESFPLRRYEPDPASRFVVHTFVLRAICSHTFVPSPMASG